MDQQKFRDLLEQSYQWPDYYDFKFIVKTDIKHLVLERLVGFSITETPSKNGTYISITARKLIQTTDEVIEVYLLVGQVQGVMSL